jgi:hypothetical protein
MTQNIFDYIKSEETGYQTLPVQVISGYEWKMFEHIKLTVLYKNSRFSTGNSDDKPFKNIIRPILNLQYRAEGFDVKDIVIFVENAYQYFKSFLIKKYHDTKWARENGIDTFIDELVETYVDFGGVLVKNVNDVRPQVVPWQRIAFCDQTDVLAGTIAEKHYFSANELREMTQRGWGDIRNGSTGDIEDLLTLAGENQKESNLAPGQKNRTPSKYIEVYELHGSFPNWWLEGKESFNGEVEGFSNQVHIVSFYKDKEGNRQGFTLYKGKENKFPYKFLSRDAIYGRALGFGGAEELFEAQVWTNYDMIRIKDMLDAASKMLFQTTDGTFSSRNKLSNADNLEVFYVEDGKQVNQIDTTPRNITLFERSVGQWENHARTMGAATESIMGEQPASGTPFKLQELITAEAHSLHEYRKGKIATFVEEIYRDWIIPYIAKEITKDQEFLAEIDFDEMQAIADNLVVCVANTYIKEKILNGELVNDEEVEKLKEKARDEFMRGGNKKFIKILEGEMQNAPLSVKVNISGKQKYLSATTDKLVNVWRTIISSPQVLDDPRMAKLFNQILEASNLSPIDFYAKPRKPEIIPQQKPNLQSLTKVATQ